jgi:hypothetical protein
MLWSVSSVQAAARQVLAELALTSVTSARAFVPAVTTNPPESAPPSGGASPADRWRAAFERAGGDGELWSLVLEARAELRTIRRRELPLGPWETMTDLAERVDAAEGVAPERIALELRCSPRKVRQLRLAAGRHPEHGRELELELEPAALLAAGMSYRAVSIATGIPRSTLHDRYTHHNP